MGWDPGMGRRGSGSTSGAPLRRIERKGLLGSTYLPAGRPGCFARLLQRGAHVLDLLGTEDRAAAALVRVPAPVELATEPHAHRDQRTAGAVIRPDQAHQHLRVLGAVDARDRDLLDAVLRARRGSGYLERG